MKIKKTFTSSSRVTNFVNNPVKKMIEGVNVMTMYILPHATQ